MKKAILSTIILGSFGLYILSQGQSNNQSALLVTPEPATIVSNKDTATATKVAVTSKPASTSSPTSTPVTIPKKKGLYNDGTYTGSVADAYYGNVQVEVIISNGKITDVRFLNYPQDRNTSRRINSQAMPYLTQEAISAQSANVNGVSGASDTSAAFRQSLASALMRAQA